MRGSGGYVLGGLVDGGEVVVDGEGEDLVG